MSTITHTKTATPPADSAEQETTGQSFRDRTLATTTAQLRALSASAKSDGRAVWYRARRQVAPLKLAAGTGALGAAGAALAEAPQVTELAAAGGTGAAALTAGFITWKKIAASVPADLRTRAQLGLASGCAWCATLPVTGPDAIGMWLAFGLGTVALSARWWKRLRPGYPDGPQAYVPQDSDASPESVPAEAEPAEEEQDDQFATDIAAWFTEHVTGPSGALPGAVIAPGTRTAAGWAFRVALDGRRHDLAYARSMVSRIGGSIGVFPDKITFEQCDDAPSSIEMRITQDSPHNSGIYQGPRIVHEGDDVFIELGPFADGDGYERYHVGTFNDELNDGSMNSGFVLGSKGSGKSRLIELIAIGLRKIGIEVWYLDPQEGSSSAALKNHADWPLMGVGEGTNPVGNAQKLLRAVRKAAAIRQKEHAAWEWTGFTHTPQRPAIMVIIDECHMVFNEINPETGMTFGAEFGELDRIIRKLGMGLLGASQIYTMETFGNSAALRSGMVAGNLIIMRMLEKAHFGLLPGSAPSPDQIPKGGGYGYSLEGARPQTLWRAEYCRDTAAWLEALPYATLDARAQKAIGADYELRFERARTSTAAAESWLAEFDAGHNVLPENTTHPTSASMTTPPGTGAGSGSSRVPRSPSATPPDAREPAPRAPEGIPERPLTERQQELVDLLAEHGQLHTDEMAQHLGISVQAVRSIIRALGETRLAASKKGVYRLA